jgi:hypothetical protein
MNTKGQERLKENIDLIIPYSKEKLLNKIKEFENFLDISEKNQYLSKVYKLVYNAKCTNALITSDEVVRLKEQGRISDKQIMTTKPINTIVKTDVHYQPINKNIQTMRPTITTQDSHLTCMDIKQVTSTNLSTNSKSESKPFDKVVVKETHKEFLQRKIQRDEIDPLDVSTLRDSKGEFMKIKGRHGDNDQPKSTDNKQLPLNVISKPAQLSKQTIIIEDKKGTLMPSKTKSKRTSGYMFNPQFYKSTADSKNKEMENELKNFLSEIDKQ